MITDHYIHEGIRTKQERIRAQSHGSGSNVAIIKLPYAYGVVNNGWLRLLLKISPYSGGFVVVVKFSGSAPSAKINACGVCGSFKNTMS